MAMGWGVKIVERGSLLPRAACSIEMKARQKQKPGTSNETAGRRGSVLYQSWLWIPRDCRNSHAIMDMQGREGETSGGMTKMEKMCVKFTAKRERTSVKYSAKASQVDEKRVLKLLRLNGSGEIVHLKEVRCALEDARVLIGTIMYCGSNFAHKIVVVSQVD
jgi:hypothetical protein